MARRIPGEKGDEGAVMSLYQIYFTSQGDIRELAFEALWNLAARGIEIPPPMQFGLK